MNHNPLTIEQMRELMHNFKIEKRLRQRELLADHLRFGLGEIQQEIKDLRDFKQQDVHDLAEKIKRKRHATEEDLYQLSHAFLQSELNIRTFFNTPGALSVLIKELTGMDAKRQQGAADCICNLANINDTFICEKLCDVAGIYLVTYLDSVIVQLKRTCLWTMQNLTANSSKATQTLIEMELVPKLWALYIAEDMETIRPVDDFRKDAGLCLQLMSIHSDKVLRIKDKKFLLKNLCSKDPYTEGSEYYLQMIFFWNVAALQNELNERQLLYLIDFILHNFCLTQTFSCLKHQSSLIYALRVLSNLVIFYPHTVALLQKQAKVQWRRNLNEIFNVLFRFRNNILTSELLWVVNNIFSMEENKHKLSDFIRVVTKCDCSQSQRVNSGFVL